MLLDSAREGFVAFFVHVLVEVIRRRSDLGTMMVVGVPIRRVFAAGMGFEWVVVVILG